MLPQYSTEQLIENIKRRCTVPTSQLTYTENDFTLLANDELQGKLVPLIMSAREEYFVDDYDVLVPSDGIIDFPEHAIGAKLRSVCYLQQASPLLLINLPRLDLDVIAGVGSTLVTGFYIEGNTLRIYPSTALPTNTTLKIYFYRRTLVLAEPAQYGQILSIDTGSNTVVISRTPTDWAVGTQLNTVSQKPNFETTAELLTVTAVSAPSVVLDTVVGIGVGDYLSGYGYSAIPQIPLEAHAYLAQLTAAMCLRGLGDREGAKDLEVEADLLKVGMFTMISQRVDGSVKKVINPDGGLRMGIGGRWGGARGGF